MRDRAKEDKVIKELEGERRWSYEKKGWCLGKMERMRENKELRRKELISKERR